MHTGCTIHPSKLTELSIVKSFLIEYLISLFHIFLKNESVRRDKSRIPFVVDPEVKASPELFCDQNSFKPLSHSKAESPRSARVSFRVLRFQPILESSPGLLLPESFSPPWESSQSRSFWSPLSYLQAWKNP